MFFVDHMLVSGTWKGYDLYRSVEDPMARALTMMLLVSNVYPLFLTWQRLSGTCDDECRLGRAVQRRHSSVYRGEYRGGSKRLSNYRESEVDIRVGCYAQLFCSRHDFANWATTAEAVVRSCDAFEEPAEDIKLVLPSQPVAAIARSSSA